MVGFNSFHLDVWLVEGLMTQLATFECQDGSGEGAHEAAEASSGVAVH